MSPAAAQLQFGAEFLGFLAAIAGVALALLRAAPRRPPPGVAVAFGALAAVAFVAGSRLVEDRGDAWVALPRLLAAGLLAGTVVLWEVEARTKALLLAGAFVTALAVPLVAVDLTVVADAAVAAGGLFMGGAVLDLARRSVASRFAVSGGASLLVIVLVLSVAMSAVVDSNLRSEAVKRLDDRAAAEAGGPRKNLGVLVRVAALARDRLVAAETANPDQPDERVRAIEAALAELSRLSFDNEAYLYIGADNASASPLSPSATVLGEVAKRNLGPARVVALAGDPVVQDARCPATSAPGVTVVLLDDKAYGVVANPLCTGVSTLLGRLVVLSPLDNGRLTEAIGVDGGPISLALHAASRVVAQSGDQPEPAAIRVLAGAVLRDGKKRSALVGERFVSAAPVVVLPNRPATLVLVASSPTATISQTRDGLFRALFAIALLGTLVALLLAALVGERIGARLRNLTQAAEALILDSPGVRTGLTGDDELGTLGRTFDNMASAIEEKTKDQKRLSDRLEAVVNEMGEALVATDAQARITEFNRSAVHLIGMSTEAARGAQVDQVVSLSAADDGFDLPTRLKLPPRNQWSTRATLDPLYGPPVPVAISGAPLSDPDGGPAGGVFVIRDRREELKYDRMKTELLSCTGHELRTPLGHVLVSAAMLLRRQWPADTQELLEIINKSGHSLERIVELLEFSTAAVSGRTVLRSEPLDLRRVVNDVLSEWAPRIRPPLRLTRKIERGLPPVLGDARWLQRALSELVDNAIKWSPVGGTVVISAVRGDNHCIDLSVTDHGLGMTAETAKRAFDDFEQGDSSDTRQHGGLGLGLPFVHRVVKGHRGEVRWATPPGGGTRITLLLPTQ